MDEFARQKSCKGPFVSYASKNFLKNLFFLKRYLLEPFEN